MAVIRLSMDAVIKRAQDMGPATVAAARRGLLSAAHRLRERAIRQSRAAGAMDTGRYVQSWKAMPTENGAVTYNDAPYAGIIEFGRRAGARQPPVSALIPWIRRKLRLSPKEAASAAFAIAREIGRKGIKGRMIMQKTAELARTYALEEVRREVAKVLGGGK